MSDHDNLITVESIARGSRRDESMSDEVRSDRSAVDDSRASRGEGGISDEERLDIFRNAFMQAALPTLPKIDGWHLCWVSTTSDRDTIPLRISLGYVLVQPSEVSNWSGGNITTIKSGQYQGAVGHNEMVAMKIKQELYDRYMQEVHHEAPRSEDQKLLYTAEKHAENARRVNGNILVGDGLEEIKTAASVRRGIFN